MSRHHEVLQSLSELISRGDDLSPDATAMPNSCVQNALRNGHSNRSNSSSLPVRGTPPRPLLSGRRDHTWRLFRGCGGPAPVALSLPAVSITHGRRVLNRKFQKLTIHRFAIARRPEQRDGLSRHPAPRPATRPPLPSASALCTLTPVAR